MKNTIPAGITRRILLASAAVCAISSAASAQEELNALVWCDHKRWCADQTL